MTTKEKRVEALERAGGVGLPKVVEVLTWLGEEVPDPPEPGCHYIEVVGIRPADRSEIKFGDSDAPRRFVKETGDNDQGEEARTEEDGNR